MAMADGAIEWFSPDPRAILPLKEFHVPHTLERAVRKKSFEIRFDVSFTEVMRECAQRPETWINEEIIASYTRLHEFGYAHSIEAWQDGRLAGGLYGVAIGGAFFGESMFHHIREASKVALLRFGRAPPEAPLRSPRYPVDHASSATIRRHRNPACRLPPSSHHRREFVPERAD